MMNSEKKNRCRELSLAEINRMAQREDSFIREAEEEHWGFIKNICSGIIADDIRIVMIAGPSSSGKTTSAYHIMRELNRLGRPAQVISLDDFYMGEKQAPLLPDGSHDYESVYALNVPKVRASLRQLLDTGRCITPIFDFNKAQPSEQTREIFLPGGTLLVEGLHGANPVITGGFEDGMRKIYVSINTCITQEGQVLVSHKEARLIRRMVRDIRTRNTSPERTMRMWDNILRGEREYIDPFVETCDIKLDTFMEYELNLMAGCGLPVIRQLQASDTYHDQGVRLVSDLGQFCPVSEKWVPEDSLIREFIG